MRYLLDRPFAVDALSLNVLPLELDVRQLDMRFSTRTELYMCVRFIHARKSHGALRLVKTYRVRPW